jgi:predicted GNAT family N-acyltransferase
MSPVKPIAISQEVEIRPVLGRERSAIYRFWYDIYVREMCRSVANVDHKRMILVDSLENHSAIFAACIDGVVVGTVRLSFPSEGTLSYYQDLYRIARDEYFDDRTVIVTRLMVSQQFRSSVLGFQLAQKALLASIERGIHYAFMDCNDPVLQYFLALGFETHAEGVVHPEFGQVHVMRYDLSDPENLPGLLGKG